MLMGLLFAVGLVLLLRFLRPERLLRVEALPDVTAFFATLQSPVTPLLPSFWAGESALRGPAGTRRRPAPGRPLDHRPRRSSSWPRAAYGRYYFAGWSKAQEARKARFTRLRGLERLVALPPRLPPPRASSCSRT